MQNYPALKALQILQALVEQGGPMTIQHIAHTTGLSPSTVHRIVQELMACGFVAKDEAAKTYAIGAETWAFAAKLKNSDYLVTMSETEMERLNLLSNETVHLIVPENDQAVYIGKKEARCQIQLRSRIGWRIPLACTSAGKLILAHHAKEWVQNYLEHNPIRQYTNHTIMQESELWRELEHVRKQGFAIDNREHNPDIVCVGAPIFDREGHLVAAISVSAPEYRFTPKMALKLAPEVKRSAQIITNRLNGREEEDK